MRKIEIRWEARHAVAKLIEKHLVGPDLYTDIGLKDHERITFKEEVEKIIWRIRRSGGY